MALRFDMNGITNEILNKLKEQLEYAFMTWENEVYNGLKHPYFGEGVRPEVSHYLKREKNIIIGYLQANTYVLADSYGTGSLMLDNNPGLAEYKRSSYWNPARKGKTIVGRRSGRYTDIFGRTHTTRGTFEGRNIENKSFGTRYHIAPTHPSYALQMAEKWLYTTYLPNAYKLAIRNINFSKYLIES